MYNIFRLDGRYVEAAFLREIFDEPATVLYQVYAVVRTIEEAIEGESTMDRQTVIGQVDRAIIEVIRALEGVEEEEIVAALLSLRDGVSRPEGIDSDGAEAARKRLLNLVNNFFYEKMTALPELRDYMEGLQKA
jgi:Mg2+ and Co2+ transporter CorA